MTEETIQSIVEKIVGGYEWKRLSKEARTEKLMLLNKFVKQIIDEFATLRQTSCNYDDSTGDCWTIDELEFQNIFKKYMSQMDIKIDW